MADQDDLFSIPDEHLKAIEADSLLLREDELVLKVPYTLKAIKDMEDFIQLLKPKSERGEGEKQQSSPQGIMQTFPRCETAANAHKGPPSLGTALEQLLASQGCPAIDVHQKDIAPQSNGQNAKHVSVDSTIKTTSHGRVHLPKASLPDRRAAALSSVDDHSLEQSSHSASNVRRSSTYIIQSSSGMESSRPAASSTAGHHQSEGHKQHLGSKPPTIKSGQPTTPLPVRKTVSVLSPTSSSMIAELHQQAIPTIILSPPSTEQMGSVCVYQPTPAAATTSLSLSIPGPPERHPTKSSSSDLLSPEKLPSVTGKTEKSDSTRSEELTPAKSQHLPQLLPGKPELYLPGLGNLPTSYTVKPPGPKAQRDVSTHEDVIDVQNRTTEKRHFAAAVSAELKHGGLVKPWSRK